MSEKNKYDVFIALIWATAFSVPMVYMATNLQDLSEAKTIGAAGFFGTTAHIILKKVMG